MMSVVARLWRTHRIVLLAFVVAVGAAGFFGFKSAAAYVYWMDPAHQDQRIEGWMTRHCSFPKRHQDARQSCRILPVRTG